MQTEVICNEKTLISQDGDSSSMSSRNEKIISENLSDKNTDASIISTMSTGTKPEPLNLYSTNPTCQNDTSTISNDSFDPVCLNLNHQDYAQCANPLYPIVHPFDEIDEDESTANFFPSMNMIFDQKESELDNVYAHIQPEKNSCTIKLSLNQDETLPSPTVDTSSRSLSFDAEEYTLPPLFQFQLDESYNYSSNILQSSKVLQHATKSEFYHPYKDSPLKSVSGNIKKELSVNASLNNKKRETQLHCRDTNNVTSCNSRKRSIGKTYANISQLNNSERNHKLKIRRSDRNKSIQKTEKDISKNEKQQENIVKETHYSDISFPANSKENSHFLHYQDIQQYESNDSQNLSCTSNPLTSNEDTKVCKCSKSKCLKLYCECFQAGQICGNLCDCRNCQNTEENSQVDGIRTKTINSILARRPDAFQERKKKSGQGCKCKKNK